MKRHRRLVLLGIGVLATIAALLGLFFSDDFYFGFFYVANAGIVAVALTTESALRYHSTRDKRYQLRGFNDEFIKTWANQIDIRNTGRHIRQAD
jgi:hypothetical protein